PRRSVPAGPNKKLPPRLSPLPSRAPLPPCTGSNPSRQTGALPQWKCGTGAGGRRTGRTEHPAVGAARGPRTRTGCPFGWSVPETPRPEFLVTLTCLLLAARGKASADLWPCRWLARSLRSQLHAHAIRPHLASTDVTP
ncbi:hypothetical protein PVAP13_2KG350510, partial [Panicum virgatum]